MQQPPHTIDYYFSFISLWSYIGSRALRGLVERRALQVVFKPVDLMAVFAASGGLPVKERAAARQAYRFVEMQRYRALRAIPLVLEPKFYPALTHEAIERKVFGAPFFFWRGEPFWGQDRLDLLEAAIASNRPAIAYRGA